MCDICICILHVMYHDRNMPETFEAQVSQFSGEKTVLSFASACCFDRCLPVASTLVSRSCLELWLKGRDNGGLGRRTQKESEASLGLA